MGVFFLFKRVVGMVVQPLPTVIFFLLLALALCLFTRRRKNAIASLIAALIVLLASTFPPLVRYQASFLERKYAPLTAIGPEQKRPAAVVVLGNGVAHPGDGNMPALTRLNDCARARLVKGVRLWRQTPEAMLITTGYGMGLENCGDVMALAAEELGVAADKLHRFSESLDTEHEAGLVAKLVGDGEVVLVTSAVHMPRAMQYFADQGVKAVAAPCDYIAPLSDASFSAVNRSRWRPRGGSLADSEELWHEAMGLFYVWVRSW